MLLHKYSDLWMMIAQRDVVDCPSVDLRTTLLATKTMNSEIMTGVCVSPTKQSHLP